LSHEEGASIIRDIPIAAAFRAARFPVMSDPCDGIEAPCRPAGWQSERVTGARALPISLATSHGFALPGGPEERSGVLRATGRPMNGRSARALAIQLASMTKQSCGEGPRAGLRWPIGTGMLGDRVRHPDRALTIVTG
jgi:hypothetical protein